jgi:hypothetical protein
MCADRPIMFRSAANILSHSKSVNAAKQSQEAHDDQVNRDDLVKQSRYHEDQDTGDQRHERSDCQYGHSLAPRGNGDTYSFHSKTKLTPPAIIAGGANPKPLPPRDKPLEC